MQLNFQQFNVPTDITGKQQRVVDVREGLANLIYTNVNGISAHALALKIYNSKGEEEYSDAEMKVILNIANELCTPMFIDGLKQQIEKDD